MRSKGRRCRFGDTGGGMSEELWLSLRVRRLGAEWCLGGATWMGGGRLLLLLLLLSLLLLLGYVDGLWLWYLGWGVELYLCSPGILGGRRWELFH